MFIVGTKAFFEFILVMDSTEWKVLVPLGSITDKSALKQLCYYVGFSKEDLEITTIIPNVGLGIYFSIVFLNLWVF